MHLPCFCLYYLKNSMFICPKEPGIQKLKTSIPYSYFRDFADNMSPEEVAKEIERLLNQRQEEDKKKREEKRAKGELQA